MSKKDGTEEGGWVHANGAKRMAVSGLNFRKALVDTWWTVSPLLCTSMFRTQSSHLVRPPFPALKVFLQSRMRQLFYGVTSISGVQGGPARRWPLPRPHVRYHGDPLSSAEASPSTACAT